MGDPDLVLERLAALERAGPRDLTFVSTAAHLRPLQASRAGAVLLPEALAATATGPTTRLIVADLGPALRRIAEYFAPPRPSSAGVSPDARIDPSARVGPDATIAAFVVVGPGVSIGPRVVIEPGAVIAAGVTIGADVRIGPGAVCCEGAELGDRVVLKAGAVIGGPGFGFLRGATGHERLPHLGRCILEDDVEIGSATCVDRGNFADTVIGRGTKIDNLVQVGHNVRMGERCLVMATTGIAGSVRIGNDVTVLGGVGIADHAVIGDAALIGAKSVVFGGNVPPGAVVSGYPARPHRTFLRAQAALYRLSESADTLIALARRAEHEPSYDLPPD